MTVVKPSWRRVIDDDGFVQCDEGESYLFAQEMSGGGHDYFVNRLVWDSETDPTWGDDDPGYEPAEDMWFMPLPEGPKP